MNFSFFSLFLFLSFFSSESNTETIRWSETKKLTWADFKGVPKKESGFVATTSSGISFSYSYSINDNQLNLKYTIESNFYPKKSWYIRSVVTPYILKHEQTHFDISELRARKLRKRMAETSFSLLPKNKIDAIYQENELERQNMQHRYDNETDHSKITEKEHAWRAFITQQLKVYEHWN